MSNGKQKIDTNEYLEESKRKIQLSRGKQKKDINE